ncbi:copia protein [Tanacetum coccineum]
MAEPSWIDAMQEEIHEFQRLEVWELVLCPDKVLLIKLKWIYKVKMDEFGGVLKNKARLVAQGFSFLISQHFSKGAVDPTLFTRQAGNDLLLMSFFLGLQISQSPRGIFINQSKYAYEIVKKYGMLTTDSVDTPLVEKSKLDEDLQGKQVDATLYRGMIGSLMYLTSRSGYQQKDRKPSQNDKTEHGMEKTVQNQGQSPKMPKSESILKNQQSNRSRN